MAQITYTKFLNSKINLAPLGVAWSNDTERYFCTPEKANILGWAGVDGIHYCFIRGLKDVVFSVSPMNGPSDYVHPLAKNFEDFLRLLLACADAGVLEQAWRWDLAEFEAFLRENPASDEQREVLAEIQDKFQLEPMENPWWYLKELQANFDYSKIRYTEDFYDPDMNPDAARIVREWKVYFDGNFWTHDSVWGRPGCEITVNREFDWAGRHWVIPAVHSCDKGLVVDYFMRVEPKEIERFMEKWDLTVENEAFKEFSREEEMQMDLENPLTFSFGTNIVLNSVVLRSSHGSGLTYNPCIPENYAYEPERESRWVVEHYGLDLSAAWVIWRFCYPWGTKRRVLKIKSLFITMQQEPVSIPGPHFSVSSAGEYVSFINPTNQKEYTLVVQDFEKQELPVEAFAKDKLEYPLHYYAMTYTVSPEISNGELMILDAADSDQPRKKHKNEKNPYAPASIADVSLAIIGGADGPTSFFVAGRVCENVRTACSALHFEEAECVEWRMVFSQKEYPDETIAVISEN